NVAGEMFGFNAPTLASEVLRHTVERRRQLWLDQIHQKINWELFDRGVEAFTWAALEELGHAAQERALVNGAARGKEIAKFVDVATQARSGKAVDTSPLADFVAFRQELEKPFAQSLFLWQRTPGPKGDLKQEMDTVLQMPGWSNIWTQPIQNRVDMLATGV